MEYIYENDKGFTTFDKYFTYLNSIEDVLPADVYRFASDTERYELDSPKTLHDSHLKRMEIQYGEIDSKTGYEDITLTLVLSSERHGRDHELSYSRVKSYDLVKFEQGKYQRLDLLTHEISLRDNAVVHELAFDKDAVIVICCGTFSHSETAHEEL